MKHFLIEPTILLWVMVHIIRTGADVFVMVVKDRAMCEKDSCLHGMKRLCKER
jgi:hypothetical protein